MHSLSLKALKKITLLLVLLFVIYPILGQNKIEGSVITDYGETYEVANPDFKTDTSQSFKAVFDIARTFKDSSSVSPLINTAARYLNLHHHAGISAEQMQVALVIHGTASDDILSDTAYQKKYGIQNPNTPLLQQLMAEKVQVILCGQTANHRNIVKEDIVPGVQIALSAMTALVQLQNAGYRLIHF